MTSLRGFTTVTFFADDLDAARAWYTRVFEREPYFIRDGAYLEWRVGDYRGDEFPVMSHLIAAGGSDSQTFTITGGGTWDVAALTKLPEPKSARCDRLVRWLYPRVLLHNKRAIEPFLDITEELQDSMLLSSSDDEDPFTMDFRFSQGRCRILS